MTSVFVSFRNGDEPYAAALIYDAVARRLGPDAVFRSSDSLRPASEWASEIWDQHRQSAVVVVVIGPHWLTITDQRGKRLWQRNDWVRREVAEALRGGKLVLPVLVNGARRFGRADLPPSLAGLADRQSMTLEHRNVDRSVNQVLAEICRLLAAPEGPPHPPGGEPGAGRHGWLRVWHVPPRMVGYVDRDRPLAALRGELERAGQDRPVVLHGAAGVGKTQLAVEYAYRFAGDYQLAWWVSGSQPELMWTQLATLAAAVGLPLDSGDVAAALPRLAQQLRQGGRWLLVLDDVSDPATVAGPLAALGTSADTIITSRHPDWGMLAAARQPVDRFERAESMQLLAAGLPGADPAELDLLADAVDDLPLAVAQAVTFLPGSSIPVGQYRELLHTRSRELLARGETFLYPQPLATTWSVGLERLRAATPDGWELLELICLLAPAPFPLDRLRPAPTGTPTLADPVRRADAVHALTRSGLVPVPAGRPHPHRLFQSFVLETLPPERVTQLRHAARLLLAAVDRPDPREPDSWPVYALLLPHVYALDLAASNHPGCRELLLDTAHHLVVRGDPAAAQELAAAAASRWRAELGADAAATVAADSHLARALFRLRDYRPALALDEDVLARRRRLVGEDDPLTLAAAHHVAMGRFAVDGTTAEVRELLAGVVARRTQVLGPEHADTLRSVHSLALAQRAAGDVPAALALDEPNHRALESVLGPDHPDTLRAAYALALDLQVLGRRGRVRQLAADTYHRCGRVLGADHPDTLRAAYLLAVERRAAGDRDRARLLLTDLHERRQRLLGDDHIDTLRAAYLLGTVLREAGDGTGRQLVAAAVAGLRRVGPAAG